MIAYKLIKKLERRRYKLMITNVKTNFMEPRVDKSFKHKHIKVDKRRSDDEHNIIQ